VRVAEGCARQCRQRVQPKACKRGPMRSPHWTQRGCGVNAAAVQAAQSECPLPLGTKVRWHAMHTGGLSAQIMRTKRVSESRVIMWVE
jgi:hypothetical protein